MHIFFSKIMHRLISVLRNFIDDTKTCTLFSRSSHYFCSNSGDLFFLQLIIDLHTHENTCFVSKLNLQLSRSPFMYIKGLSKVFSHNKSQGLWPLMVALSNIQVYFLVSFVFLLTMTQSASLIRSFVTFCRIHCLPYMYMCFQQKKINFLVECKFSKQDSQNYFQLKLLSTKAQLRRFCFSLQIVQNILDLVLKNIKREVSEELKFNFILIVFMFTVSRVQNNLIGALNKNIKENKILNRLFLGFTDHFRAF